MNIASAQATPGKSPLPGALAQSTASSTEQPTQGSRRSASFHSLLAGLAARTGQDDREGSRLERHTKDDKKESFSALFVPVQVLQPDVKPPLVLAFPVAPAAADPSATQLGGTAVFQSLSHDLPDRPQNDDIVAGFPIPSTPAALAGANPLAFAVQLKELTGGRVQDNAELPDGPVGGAPKSSLRSAATEQDDTALLATPLLDMRARQAIPAIPNTTKTPTVPIGAGSNGEAGHKGEGTAPRVPPAAPKDMSRAADAEIHQADANAQEATRKQQRTEPEVSLKDSVNNIEGRATPPFTALVSASPRGEPDRTSSKETGAVTAANAGLNRPQQAGISEISPIVRTQPAREISMRLTPPESPSVDIKLVDRAGSVHVAVRTADAGLAQNLQSGLSDLVHRLERKGFEAETWSPADTSGVNTASNAHSNADGSASQHGARDPREGAQQGNGGQQNHGRQRPRWVAELEESLAAQGAD